MSDNWNKQPENNSPFNNFNNQSQQPNSQNTHLNNGASPPSMPSQAGQMRSDQNYSLQPRHANPPSPALPPSANELKQPLPPQQGFLGMSNRLANLPGAQTFDNALHHVRGWTNKVAAITGHTVQPPAPPMDLYRPQVVSEPYISYPEKKSTSRRSARIRKISKQVRHRRLQKARSVNATIATILVILVVVIISTASASSAYGYSYYLQQQPFVQRYANEQLPQMTRIFDRNGNLLYEAYDPNSTVGNGGRRLTVRYQDIPRVMQDAMVAIEDKTFWTNDGVDPLAIIRAGSSQYGGASTLTQQLIKNLSGNNNPTVTRKINEAAMAIGITQQYSKPTILTMYFNVAPFGAQEAGVEIATQDYFGLTSTCLPNQTCTPAISKIEYNQTTKKNDPILGLARASLLAAIPNSPVSYDPALGPTNKAGALNRQKQVLQAMITQKMSLDGAPITQNMAKQAETITANMTFTLPTSVKRAPSFVDYIINQVETALGNGDPNAGVEAFVTGGYNIRTTIDINLDDYAQKAIQRHLYQPELQKGPNSGCGQYVTLANPTNGYYCTGEAMPANVQNGAVVVQDVKNGEILAMVGSANYNSTSPEVAGNYNDAVSPRSPGSTFKLFDYSTAFEMGWNPGITLADTMTDFPNGAQAGASVPPSETEAVNNSAAYPGVYVPSDYGAKWWNFLESITWATSNSMNIPAVRAMQFAGPEAVKEMAERLGVTFQAGQSFGYAAALGADGISPLQMVNAYATFGNGGVRVPPQTILDISNNYGVELYHYNESQPQGIRVISPQVAYEMTQVITNEPARSYEFSGDHDLSLADVDPTCATNAICNYQLAAKTGTTDNFTDNWTIGYTPEVAVAVWVGNNDNSPLINSIGITGAAPIFHSVIERALGWCNDSASDFVNKNDIYAVADQVPCGAGGTYNFPFSGHPQLIFTNPGGLTQGMSAGLPVASSVAGNGGYSSLPSNGAAVSDWMLDGN